MKCDCGFNRGGRCDIGNCSRLKPHHGWWGEKNNRLMTLWDIVHEYKQPGFTENYPETEQDRKYSQAIDLLSTEVNTLKQDVNMLTERVTHQEDCLADLRKFLVRLSKRSSF